MLTTDEDRDAADALILEVLRQSGPYVAAKEYRSMSSLGLRESADHVARIARGAGIQLPPSFR